MCRDASDKFWYAEHRDESIRTKTAAVVAVFIFYLIYSLITLLAHLFRDWKGRERWGDLFTQVSNDLAYKQVFWGGLTLIVGSVTPRPVGPILQWIYLIIIPMVIIGLVKPRLWILRTIGFFIGFALLWANLLWILLNPWCRFYYFQYLVAQPEPLD